MPASAILLLAIVGVVASIIVAVATIASVRSTSVSLKVRLPFFGVELRYSPTQGFRRDARGSSRLLTYRNLSDRQLLDILTTQSLSEIPADLVEEISRRGLDAPDDSRE